mmetsp:Transcript_70113/g.192448  ORF Transcript_70113/g.192448 Transcript_70113/m.192448 type:complete len:207 (-) Transcript_70113:255-875(-)
MARASSRAATTLPCSSCPCCFELPPSSRISLPCRLAGSRRGDSRGSAYASDLSAERSADARRITESLRASGRSAEGLSEAAVSVESDSRCCADQRSYLSCQTSAARCTRSSSSSTCSGSARSKWKRLTMASAALMAASRSANASLSSRAIALGSSSDACLGRSRWAASERWKCHTSSRLMARHLPCSSCSVRRRGCACEGEKVSRK